MKYNNINKYSPEEDNIMYLDGLKRNWRKCKKSRNKIYFYKSDQNKSIKVIILYFKRLNY